MRGHIIASTWLVLIRSQWRMYFCYSEGRLGVWSVGMNNPFTVRGMIQNPADFIGRHDELRHIFSRIETLQSCSIVGERRIGKSSLLYHIYQTGNKYLSNNLLRFIYVDLSEACAQTLVDLLQVLLKELELNPDAISLDAKPNRNLMAFSSELERLEQEGGLAVLCLDEFEAVFEYKHEFDDGFFNHLRSLVNKRKLVIISVTRQPLEIYAIQKQLTSPFFNLLSITKLGFFNEKEALEFIEYYHRQVLFTEHELFLIDHYADPHPLKLHILCDQLMDARELGWDKNKILNEYEKRCSQFFGGDHKGAMATNSAKKFFSGEGLGRWLDNLKKIREVAGGE